MCHNVPYHLQCGVTVANTCDRFFAQINFENSKLLAGIKWAIYSPSWCWRGLRARWWRARSLGWGWGSRRCARRGRAPAREAPASGFHPHQHPEGVCTDDLLLRKPGFLLSAMHSRTFRWFSASPLVFMFLRFLPFRAAPASGLRPHQHPDHGEGAFS